jgi:hypothetical protein
VRNIRDIRLALAVSLAALSLAASASPAGAAVTIGQTAPATNCAPGFEWVQPTVTSGNNYVVPSTGGVTSWVVTSWSTNANATAGQMVTMKVYRPLGGVTYQVVGHDGPRAIAPSAINTFSTSIAVKGGDLVGIHSDTPAWGCGTDSVPGDVAQYRGGNLADGASGDFATYSDLVIGLRLNVSAVVNPTNTFSLGTITRNVRKGTATLTVNVPNPGELTGSGKGVKVASAAVTSKTVSAPGAVKLTIRAKGKKKKKLNLTGKVKVRPKIKFTPTGGDSASQSVKVKLKKL